jgi:hypothetical protein
MPIQIIASDGTVAARSKNLRGVLAYSCKSAVAFVNMRRLPNSEGELFVGWYDGATCRTTFASFAVLQEWVIRRRCFRGADIRLAPAEGARP